MKQTWASRLLVGLLGLGLLLFFVAVMAISGQVALAQDAGTTSTFGAFLASSTDEQVGLAGAGAGAGAGARAGAASVLPDDLRFRLRLVHSVRFPLTEQRCYFQFFVDADGFSPLEGASLALELVEDSRVVGLNRVEIADLSGQGLSRRVREFAFDGPCSLDGLRLISATGAFQPAGVNYTAPVVTAAAAPPPQALSRHRLKPPPGAGSCPSRHLTAALGFQVRLSCPASLPGLRARHQIALCPAAWTWQRRLSCPNGCDRLSPPRLQGRKTKDEGMSEGLSATGFEALLGEKSFLLADGATGTNLFAMGLESGEAPEAWLLEHPDRVQALHQSFVEAGSDLFLTNTFGGTRHRLQLHGLDDQVGSLNRRAAQLAREVADKSGRRVLVAGSVGPTGEILAPLGKLERADAVASFAEQIEGLVEGGIDLVWIETISAPDELEAAVEAARGFDVPVCATMSFDSAGRTMMGLTPRAFAGLAADFGIDGFGANCGVGASDLMSSVLGFMDARPNRPVIAKANCGIPSYEDGQIVYSGTVEQMSAYALLARAAGARIIGGCCGTKPEHIAAMRQALDANDNPDFRVLAIEMALGQMSEGARRIAAGQDELQASSRRGGGGRRRRG